VGLNIKNEEVVTLAKEVAALARETKTEAIRRALLERRARLQAHAGNFRGRRGLRKYFEANIWPSVPSAELGRVLTRKQEDEILGYGSEGY